MAPHTKNLDRIITEIDVDEILKTLDTSKATGPDMLNLRLLITPSKARLVWSNDAICQ
jgi:hypothetical protein